jgi:hypothetical protein
VVFDSPFGSPGKSPGGPGIADVIIPCSTLDSTAQSAVQRIAVVSASATLP